MPANKKYLTASPFIRASKILAGFIGGYFVTISLHILLAQYINRAQVMITMAFTGFILWAALLIVAFVVKKAWHTWVIYAMLSLLFYSLYHYTK
jgi:F0F1-type ATP synthase assembly protein I